MYENKINFSSGYFPDYILYPFVDKQVGYDNNLIDNVNLDYYPDFSRGMYTKQLSNENSKYNNQYFGKLYSVYKICKKFWKPQEASPSCGIVANSSGIGTNKETPNTHHSI